MKLGGGSPLDAEVPQNATHVRTHGRRAHRTSAASLLRDRFGEAMAYPLDTSSLDGAITEQDRPLDAEGHA
jgi:hypothetical protein